MSRAIPDAKPRSLVDLDLSHELVSGLVLRTLAAAGRLSGGALEERLRVPYEVLAGIVDELQRAHLIVISGYVEEGLEDRPLAVRSLHLISDEGRRRAAELSAIQTHYLGPCPISFRQYAELARSCYSQPAGQVNEAGLRSALVELELDDQVVEQVGSAMTSRSSLFIYGPPGNGKSTIARRIAPLLGPPIPVPWAVAIGTEVIRVLDPVYHRMAGSQRAADGRLAIVQRPVVRAGGELRAIQLELIHDSANRHYEAPLQWKANGGVLVIDDFGRQAEPPTRILNRFIVPMEESVDYLDLSATGYKIEVPFLCQLIFSTNISPAELVDEAFLRRIAYKVEIGDPPVDAFARILQRECERSGITFDPQVVPWLLDLYDGQPLRGSHPKQLISRLVDRARFRGQAPALTPHTVHEAYRTTFIITSHLHAQPGLRAL